MLKEIKSIFQHVKLWMARYANPLKKVALTSLVIISILWCTARFIYYSHSQYFEYLRVIAAFMCLMALVLYFFKLTKYRDWGNESTKHIVGHCMFFFFLGLSWPYTINVADSFMAQDADTKSLLVVCIGIVYVVSKLKGTVDIINEMIPARAVHHFFSIPNGEYVGLKRITATHEAGHALLYACLKEVPHDVSVSIKEDLSSAGRVTALINEQSLSSTFLKWHLLVCLAGRAAELHRYQDYSVGCSDDLKQWQNLSVLYLRNGMGSFYYNTPTGDEERQHNICAIENLQIEIEGVLAEFLNINDDSLREIEDQLLEKKFISGEDLKVVLTKVTLTESMPKPKSLF
jgi:Peptidase family M41